MLTSERTSQAEISQSSGTNDRDSGADTHDGDQTEHRKNQRHGTQSTDQGSEPNTPLAAIGATDWDVDEKRVELSVAPGCVQRLKSFFKLVRAEPALSRRVP
jgi:hypothetical protein